VDASATSRTRDPDYGADTSSIRVLVADSQAIDRRALALLLRSQHDLRVVGEAANADEALVMARVHVPHVTVLSLALPTSGGEPALPWLLAAEPGLRAIAISERGWEQCMVLNPPPSAAPPDSADHRCDGGVDCLQLAMAQGALGTVRRSADPERLFGAIRAVAQGRSSHDPAALEAMSRPALPGALHRPSLSPREVEVAALIGRGCSNKEIAATLAISEPTVKKHVGRVLAKLGVQDRLQAGLFVTRHPLHLAADRPPRPEAGTLPG